MSLVNCSDSGARKPDRSEHEQHRSTFLRFRPMKNDLIDPTVGPGMRLDRAFAGWANPNVTFAFSYNRVLAAVLSRSGDL
jgi:hypothetical protein